MMAAGRGQQPLDGNAGAAAAPGPGSVPAVEVAVVLGGARSSPGKG